MSARRKILGMIPELACVLLSEPPSGLGADAFADYLEQRAEVEAGPIAPITSADEAGENFIRMWAKLHPLDR